MACFHMDDFNIYGTTTSLMLSGIYAEANGTTGGSGFALVADPDGVSTQKVLRMFTAGDRWRFVTASAQPTVGIAKRYYLNGLTTNQNAVPFVWFDSTTTAMGYVSIDATGRARLYSGTPGAGTQLAITAGPVVTAGSWWHMECKFTNTTTPGTGAVELRIEGTTVLTASGLTFASNSPVYSIGSQGVNLGITQAIYEKDLFCWDSTGTYNNNFAGTVLVNNISPASDVALNWTPSTGSTGWQILDQIPPNDSQYISAPFPLPANYEATFTTLPNTFYISSVKAILTRARAVKSDGGDGSLQVSVKSGSATSAGANRPITTSMTYWSDVFEIDPNTSLPWTPTSVNLVHGILARTL